MIIRRSCGVSVSVAPLYRCPHLLTVALSHSDTALSLLDIATRRLSVRPSVRFVSVPN